MLNNEFLKQIYKHPLADEIPIIFQQKMIVIFEEILEKYKNDLGKGE